MKYVYLLSLCRFMQTLRASNVKVIDLSELHKHLKHPLGFVTFLARDFNLTKIIVPKSFNIEIVCYKLGNFITFTPFQHKNSIKIPKGRILLQ